jgi:hypothetical protein
MTDVDPTSKKSRVLNIPMTMAKFQCNVYIMNSPQSKTFRVSLKRLPRIFILRYLRVELELTYSFSSFSSVTRAKVDLRASRCGNAN